MAAKPHREDHWTRFTTQFCLYFVTGDGGNDVSMIQAADCGIGIEGKVKTLTVTVH